MEVPAQLFRPRHCTRCLQIFLTFIIFSIFLIFFHQFRPKTSEYLVSNMGLFGSWRSHPHFVRVGGASDNSEDSTTGVLPIALSHTTVPKEKSCLGESSPMLDGILLELPVGRARYDNRRLLRIYDFLQVGKDWENSVRQYSICLATQSSIERIYWLPQVLEHWDGPLSIAVHISNEEEWLILNLFTRYLERCYPAFRDRVSLHLAIPASIGPFCYDEKKIGEWNRTNIDEVRDWKECSEPKRFMLRLLEMFPVKNKQKLAFKEVYPQNHMRNIARKACGTDWTYSTDVDIIPSRGMAKKLQEFYETMQASTTPCPKCAFVIPTFELDETRPFPNTKEDIVKDYKAGNARQFHGKFFSIGHKATNYRMWSTTHLKEGPVQVSHPIVSSQTYLYEPFYIGPDLIPPYDERFLGYGFTRNSQFQEALFAGWNFTVLTPVFSIHWGLQTSKTLLSPKKDGVGSDVRRQQTSANSKLFRKILKEMKLKKQEGLF